MSINNFLGDIKKPKEIAENQASILRKLAEKTKKIKDNCKEQNVNASLASIEINLLLASGYNQGIAKGTLTTGEPRISRELAEIKGQLASIKNLSIALPNDNDRQAAEEALEQLTLTIDDLDIDTVSKSTPVEFDTIINEMIIATTSSGLDSETKGFQDKYQSNIGYTHNRG